MKLLVILRISLQMIKCERSDNLEVLSGLSTSIYIVGIIIILFMAISIIQLNRQKPTFLPSWHEIQKQ